jgi:hypothetical protein
MPPDDFDALCINDFYSARNVGGTATFDSVEPEMQSGSGFGTGYESGANIIWNTRVKNVF